MFPTAYKGSGNWEVILSEPWKLYRYFYMPSYLHDALLPCDPEKEAT